MALGAILAAALTDHSPRSKGLYLDNFDVIRQPGTTGNLYGVPIESVHVTEVGPGGVSSMEFEIDDPQLAVTVTEGMIVRFHDITRDRPIFTGFLQDWHVRPAFGDQGRTISIKAIGVEILLDWCVVPADRTFPAGTLGSTFEVNAAIQSLVNTALGPAGLVRAVYSVGVRSTQAFPMDGASVPSGNNADDLVIDAGTSLREAIRQLLVARTTVTGWTPMVTVDFTYGLRTWQAWSPPIVTFDPTDYATLTINDAPAGPVQAEPLDYGVDAAAVVRGVVVQGTGVQATVTDGTGLPGVYVSITDTKALTVARCQSIGYAYLSQFASGIRGILGLEDIIPPLDVHAGSEAVITDARVGLAAVTLRIAQIDKTFNDSDRDDWRVSFGGPRPSGAALIRRLTRNTLS